MFTLLCVSAFEEVFDEEVEGMDSGRLLLRGERE
jgi:hypothetical protein